MLLQLFCLCNKSSHTLTVAVSSKWKNIGGFLRPGTKYTRNFGQEVFGTYRDVLSNRSTISKASKSSMMNIWTMLRIWISFIRYPNAICSPPRMILRGRLATRTNGSSKNSPTVVCAGSISSPTMYSYVRLSIDRCTATYV